MFKKMFFLCVMFFFVIGCATNKPAPEPVQVSATANATANAVAIGDGSVSSTIPMAKASASSGSGGASVCESVSCGNRFPIGPGNWQYKYFNEQTGVGYYYEILDRGGCDFKVKPMAILKIDGQLWGIHLPGCARGMTSVEACLDYLEYAGFSLEQDGAETPGGGTGAHRTVMRGPIYKVPENLIIR